MTTIGIIAEQIQRLHKRATGSDDATKFVIDRREIKPLIVQVANTLLQAKAKGPIDLGDISTPPSTIISYNNIPVTIADGRSTAALPVYPLPLIRDIGVWSVIPRISSIDGVPYIPITASDWDLLRGLDEGLLEGQVGYYVEGLAIYLTSAIPAAWVTLTPYIIGSVVSYGGFQWRSLTNHTDAVVPVEGGIWNKVTVKIKLLVADISTLGDTDIFPVSPDIEALIIKEVLAILRGVTIPVQPNITNEDKN